jgi:UDP-N-acetylmuramate--alanine ligase
LNSLAAAAVGLEMGLEPETVVAGLAELKGVGRRFEKKGEARGVTFLDDYGHHPTEIRATLSALTECFPRRRRVVVFQPHRPSRTQNLFKEFISAFNQTDRLIVTDIYGAGEAPIEGVDAWHLTEAIRSHGHRDVSHQADLSGLAEILAAGLAPGDVFLTLGAGNIHLVGEETLRLMGRMDENGGEAR